MEGLHEIGVNNDIIAAIQIDLTSGTIPEKEKSLLYLAEQLTLHPSTATVAVQVALNAGWENVEIANAIFLVSYFNMVTRIADAFNLPPDDYHQFNPSDSLPIFFNE